jgi:drug/metabolite transporter (DMT)-like permease
MIAFMGFLAFRDKLTAIQALGILISLVGVLTVISHGEFRRLLGLELSIGDAWILGGFACYSAYSVLLRKRPPLHWLSFLTITFLLGIIALTPVYLWDVARGGTFEPTLANAAAIGYVALFASVMAYVCFNRGVELIGANRAGSFFHMVPLQGTVLAILLLGEELHLFHVVAFALIITGVMLASRAARRE